MEFHQQLASQVITAFYVCFALWKLTLVVQIVWHGPVKQAKRYSMTASITEKINAIIYVFTAYVFYEAVMAAYQQPDATPYKLVLDLGFKLFFFLITLSLFGAMMAELHTNAGLGGAGSSKVQFLVRALNRRKMYLTEFFVVMPSLAFAKYITSGTWEPLTDYIGNLLR